MPTGTLIPWFPQQFLIPSSGLLASGYKVFSYVAGTTTKQNTYTDSTMASANTNPIVLNSYGMPANGIYLDPTLPYKLVLASPTDTDPPVSPLLTQDNLWGFSPQVYPYARRYAVDSSTIGCVNTTETQLGAFTLTANTLSSVGQVVRVMWAGSVANNGNNKTFKVYIGGTQVATYTYSNNNQGWRVQTEFVLIGATSFFAMTTNFNASQPAVNGTASVSPAVDEVIKLTGTGGASNDIVENMMLAELWP